MNNPDAETRFWTTTKNQENTIGYFVFHTFGKYHGFYDWVATLTVDEQKAMKDETVSVIRSVLGTNRW